VVRTYGHVTRYQYLQDMALPDAVPTRLHFLQPTACIALTQVHISPRTTYWTSIILCQMGIVPLERCVKKGEVLGPIFEHEG
jgi:hypothetical protein